MAMRRQKFVQQSLFAPEALPAAQATAPAVPSFTLQWRAWCSTHRKSAGGCSLCLNKTKTFGSLTDCATFILGHSVSWNEAIVTASAPTPHIVTGGYINDVRSWAATVNEVTT